MRRIRHPAYVTFLLALAHAFLPQAGHGGTAGGPNGKEKSKPATVRWNEDQPGCTFSRTEDGKYSYGLWSGDVGITMSVDAQELQKVHRRNEPFLGVLLDVRYRGKEPLDLHSGEISLEFVSHYKVIQHALSADTFSQKIQKDADELDRRTAREVAKHPEQKEAKEAYVRAFQKETAELLEFVSKNNMRWTLLDPETPEMSGWVLFATDSKWLGSWKPEEDFVLRIPVEEKIFEFPFKLPPKQGELILRKRE
jgi:hypothetical protein